MVHGNYKKRCSFENRQQESARIRAKYIDRIPVVCEIAKNSDNLVLDKTKYLVPDNLTIGQFVYVVRKRLKVTSDKAIFIFINNMLPPTAMLLDELYKENKDDDGFLYCVISSENTFGK